MESVEDLNRRYGKTYCRVLLNDESKRFAFLEWVEQRTYLAYMQIDGLGAMAIKLNDEVWEKQFDFTPPHTGLFNHNGHAIMLFRTPARQWRRGFCQDNHEFYNPFKRLFKVAPYKPPFGWNSIRAAFHRVYIPDLDKAVAALQNCNSVAMSRNLMLSKSLVADNDDAPMIWYRTEPVGYVVKKRIIIEDHDLRQEIVDETKRLGGDNWIS